MAPPGQPQPRPQPTPGAPPGAAPMQPPPAGLMAAGRPLAPGPGQQQADRQQQRLPQPQPMQVQQPQRPQPQFAPQQPRYAQGVPPQGMAPPESRGPPGVANGQPPPEPAQPLLNPAVRPRGAVQRRQYAHEEVAQAPTGSLLDALPAPLGGPQAGALQSMQPSAASPFKPAGLNREQSNRSIDPSQIPRPAPLPESAALATGTVEVLTSRELIGRVPPLASSAYTVHDDGNAPPRYIRLPMNSLMNTHDHFQDPRMPMGAVLQPLAPLGPDEQLPPCVDFGEAGPPRCSRCRAYVNPFWTFVDGGRRLVCNLCGASSDVAHEYFCNLGVDGMRRDVADRPELCRGVCEFVAPAPFQARPPRTPPLVFLLEATSTALRSGLFANACAIIGALATELPSYTEVGVITFDDTLHYHPLTLEPGAAAAPKLLVCPDVDDPCVPLPCSRLVRPLGVVRAALQELLASLPSLLSHQPRAESALGAALTAAHEMLLPTGGRIVCLAGLLPTRGVLKLKDRSRVAASSSDVSSKEKELLTPAPEWAAFAKRLVAAQVSVHTCHFAGGPKHAFADVASVSHLARATGGATYIYPECHPEARPDTWAVRLHSELRALLLRESGWEGVLRVRCSKGLRVTGYTTGVHKAGDVDLDLPSIDAETTLHLSLEHEEKLETNSVAYLQAALLYTTNGGHRRLRVINSAITSTTHISNVFRYADLETILNIMLRSAMIDVSQKRMCAHPRAARRSRAPPTRCAPGALRCSADGRRAPVLTARCLSDLRSARARARAQAPDSRERRREVRGHAGGLPSELCVLVRVRPAHFAREPQAPAALRPLAHQGHGAARGRRHRPGRARGARRAGVPPLRLVRAPLHLPHTVRHPSRWSRAQPAAADGCALLREARAARDLPARLGAADDPLVWQQGRARAHPAARGYAGAQGPRLLAARAEASRGQPTCADGECCCARHGGACQDAKGASERAAASSSTLAHEQAALGSSAPRPAPSAQTHEIIRSLGSQRGGHYPRVQIASADDGNDVRFLAMLTEDRSQAAMSYVEFLCHVHRQIQTKIS